MLTLEAVAFIIIYYICMLCLCWLYSSSRFYKEEHIFISYDTNESNNYINMKKMA